jgi:hypothetical protein
MPTRPRGVPRSLLYLVGGVGGVLVAEGAMQSSGPSAGSGEPVAPAIGLALIGIACLVDRVTRSTA